MCRKRGQKVNAGKCKVMVLNAEEGLEREVHLDGIRLEHISEFKFVVFWTTRVHMRQSVKGRWRVGGGLQELLDVWLMLRV